ncbi:glycosyltransferase family 4 protein [Larkinella harenae]
MKVLIIHNQYKYKGGEDSVVNNEAALLKSKGITVEILLFSNESFKNSSSNIFKTITNTVYNLDSKKEIEKKIESFNPDVIHVHNLFYYASPSILFPAKKANIPVVMTIHNFRLICIGSTLLRNNEICEICVNKIIPLGGIINKCFQNSLLKSFQLTLVISLHKYFKTWNLYIDRYIFLTDFTKRKFIDSALKISPKTVTVKPNFIEDLGCNIDRKRENFFLFVGRLSKEKGIELLIESLKKRTYNIEIIGDGPLASDIEKISNELPNVKYLGKRDLKFIREKMMVCQALLFTSIWYEGMPMTILESFSTATPVIATDLDNINEIVVDGFNGLLFTKNKPEDLNEKIKKFLKLDKTEMYKNARLDYENKYNSEANFHQLYTIYNDAISNKNN